jgi:hypothetical protein
MAGIVLALAGLTCADGGPGAGSALEPVARDVAGPWVGRFHEAAGPGGPARLNGGPLVLRGPGKAVLFGGEFAYVFDGVPVKTSLPNPCHVLYRFEAGQLALCLNPRTGEQPNAFREDMFNTFLLTVKPAAPRER